MDREPSRLDALKARFAAAGIRPDVRRGQNFLIDGNLPAFIARLGGPGPDDVVLEVGPGAGVLTKELAATGAAVLAVELDGKLFQLVTEDFRERPNVSVLAGDILDGKHALNPAVEPKLRELLTARGSSARLLSVSNLPYSAGTPFVAILFASPLPWRRGVFLLQREVAERLVAEPGGAEYGSLAIQAKLAAAVTIERKVPPEVFWPRPTVESALVAVEFRSPEERAAIPWAALRSVVAAVFSARRKTLRNALRHLLPRERIESLREALGIDPDARGESLPPERFLALARLPDFAADASV